ncbi:DUF4437 domain-containing protein [Candidatus Uabimicrobium amorphum]|uniref:DUF4437 domain-containing protein n=1 Tax=Uabimicrobium amorphum TaxID=2596890 RepID=A0A5S9F4T6_UABAM|nr:DUF4437 domain-containing protein [Candidatus Uabimicrobium amorphum]BBM84939.1 hypothetical protein UABAM_03300 [Candidatus Uabimicrobium amorphum]
MQHAAKLLRHIFISMLIITSTWIFCDESTSPLGKSENTVVLVSEVKWEQLNPARGDKSPQAGTLWGDRNGSSATGFLLKPSPGFQSPPHIHNVSYRGVVIRGLIHNDDPGAEYMWMPQGSFWTQPKGQDHITAAKGNDTLAYIEIDEAPYLVLPSKKAFDSGERPVNIDRSNIVWTDTLKNSISKAGVRIAYLWGTPQQGKLNGTMVKMPSGFSGEIQTSGSNLRAIVIKGKIQYTKNKNNIKTLAPGSYFSSKGEARHQIACASECILYIRTYGKFRLQVKE